MQDTPVRLTPVEPGERLLALDALRGFALLGIGLMNVEFFSRPMQGIMLGFDDTLQGVDRAAGWAVMAFVQGKFWTLFSLLFGIGFAVMFRRADALRADPGFNALYLRRLAVLLAIGFAHAVLLWPGDILVPYALSGFVLLLLVGQMPTAHLWKLGLLLYFVPVGLLVLSMGVVGLAQLDAKAGAELTSELARTRLELEQAYTRAAAVYGDGDWLAVTKQRLADTWMQYTWLPMMLPSVLGMFLLGAWLLLSGRLHDIAAHRGFYRRLLWIGGPAGVVLAVVAMFYVVGSDMTLPTPGLTWGVALMTLGGLLLCLAYASAVVLLVHGPWPGLGRLLAPVGRMALTNYLLQSLVFSTLFYGYGFGLWGQVPRLWQLVLVVGLFVLQVLLSHLWMARFRFGPMEWLWRTLTYGRAPAMR